MNPDGSRLIVFPNGTRKTVSADQLSITVHFFNGDIKQIQPDHTVVSASPSIHTLYVYHVDGNFRGTRFFVKIVERGPKFNF